MGSRGSMIGVVACVLALCGCGEASDGVGGTVAPASVAGDQAVWLTAEGMPALGYPPVDGATAISADSSSFTAYVSRMACSNGVTGTVLAPDIELSDTQVVVTFAVEPWSSVDDVTCPGNDLVPTLVDLGQPIGGRALVDGACATPPASTTTFCRDGGVRWSPAGTVPAPTLDLEGVIPESVPMAIAEHLSAVAQAVAADVGASVYGGATSTNLDNDAITIYGTDAVAIEASLDRIGSPLRDRITVVETQYTVAEIEDFAAEAQARLDAAGIAGSAGVGFGVVDAVAVEIETPDGAPDDALEAMAVEALAGIPVSISFRPPDTEL